MIKGASSIIHAFTLYPAPSRADSWEVLIAFHHKYSAVISKAKKPTRL